MTGHVAPPVGVPMLVPVVVMGVAGTGKSTVAQRLAERLGAELVEGDEHHPPTNIAKMSAGTPLTDADREPWLRSLAAILADRAGTGRPLVLTCSALKRGYRDLLRSGGDTAVVFVHLVATYDVLLDRMTNRDHFMPTSLLRSQLDTLEPLQEDEVGFTVPADDPLDGVVAAALEGIRAAVR